MSKLNFFAIIFAIFIFSFISCQKNNPVESDTDFAQYLPLLIGNYWKFDVYQTDTSGKRIANTDSYIIKVMDTLFYQGKKAVKIDNDGSIEYWAIEGSKLYAWGAFDDDESMKWLLIADLKGSKWTLLEKEIETEYDGLPINGTLIVTCSKGKKENKIIKGKPVESQQFVFEMTLQGYGYIDETMKIPINFKNRIQFWYGKNVGMVLQVAEPSEINIGGIINKMYGEEHELIDYILK